MDVISPAHVPGQCGVVIKTDWSCRHIMQVADACSCEAHGLEDLTMTLVAGYWAGTSSCDSRITRHGKAA